MKKIELATNYVDALGYILRICALCDFCFQFFLLIINKAEILSLLS